MMSAGPESATGPGQPPQARPQGRAGRWLAVGTAVWALVLIGVAALSASRDAPTVREQRSIAQAAPVIDRALGELITAGQGPDVALEISQRLLENGCRLNATRSGATLERSLTIRTTEAAAPAVLDRVAERLPPGYRSGVQRRDGGAAPRLWADAGDFVGITGTVSSPGVVTLTAKTGCRPPSPEFDQDRYDPPPATAGEQLRAALEQIGADAVRAEGTVTAPCPGGGAPAATARANGHGELAAAARAELGRLPDAVVIVDTADLLAVGYGAGTVVVRPDGDRLDAAFTTGCRGQ